MNSTSVDENSAPKRKFFDITVAHLFSGPAGRSDGFAAELAKRGIHCMEFDIVNDPHAQNLVDEGVFQDLMLKITSGTFEGLLMGPPCETFSVARCEDDGGPKPLREAWGKGLYGKSDLSREEKEQARVGTLLAFRALFAFKAAIDQGIPAVHEHPLEQPDQVSVYHFPEWQEVLRRPGVRRFDIVQCHLGALSVKPTTLITWLVELDHLPTTCKHPRHWMRVKGVRTYRAHQPLWGKDKRGRYKTKKSAAYPHLMNYELALVLSEAALKRRLLRMRRPNGPGGLGRTWNRDSIREFKHPQVDMTWNLAGVEPDAKRRRRLEDDSCIGGLRNPSRNNHRLSQVVSAGSAIREIISDTWKVFPSLQADILQLMSNKDAPLIDLEPVRAFWGSRLGVSDVGKVDSGTCKTDLRYGLLKAIASKAADPDRSIVEWLVEGAPAGIRENIQDPGIFPVTDDPVDAAEDEMVSGWSELEGFSSYSNVEGDPEAGPVIEDFINTGFVKVVDSLEEARLYLGESPVLSKLAMITKHIYNQVGDLIRTKRRLILDCLRSGVNDQACRTHRIVLPRLIDACNGMLETLRHRHPVVKLFAIDISDAFWQLPLRCNERRYFCTKYRGKYIIYERLAQGSRNAPLAWCRFIALVSRITAGVFAADPFQLQTFVDDPLVIVGGTEQSTDELAAAFTLFWMILGFKLAFPKAQYGQSVIWIGAKLTFHTDGVEVAVKDETVEALLGALRDFRQGNLISLKQLRSFAGKCSHVASLIPVWRPFIRPLWAAIAQAGSANTGAPKGTVWTKQVHVSLMWLEACLTGQTGTLRRVYPLEPYLNQGDRISIIFDASPWGLGAVLTKNHTPIAWFASPLGPEDELMFNHKRGDSAGQQTWEALSLLVALKAWRAEWARKRVIFETVGDSVSALTVASALKTSGAGASIIAQETALEYADMSFAPCIIAHIPGVANVRADLLSRKFDPRYEQGWSVPLSLKHVPETSAPRRTAEFFRLQHSQAERQSKV